MTFCLWAWRNSWRLASKGLCSSKVIFVLCATTIIKTKKLSTMFDFCYRDIRQYSATTAFPNFWRKIETKHNLQNNGLTTCAIITPGNRTLEYVLSNKSQIIVTAHIECFSRSSKAKRMNTNNLKAMSQCRSGEKRKRRTMKPTKIWREMSSLTISKSRLNLSILGLYLLFTMLELAIIIPLLSPLPGLFWHWRYSNQDSKKKKSDLTALNS